MNYKKTYSKYGYLIGFEIACTKNEARIILSELWPEYANEDCLFAEMTDDANHWRSFYKNGVMHIYRYIFSERKLYTAPLPSNVIKIVEKYLRK